MSSTRSLAHSFARPSCRQHVRWHVRTPLVPPVVIPIKNHHERNFKKKLSYRADSSRRPRRGHNVANFLRVCPCRKVESLRPKCNPGGELVEHVLGATPLFEQLHLHRFFGKVETSLANFQHHASPSTRWHLPSLRHVALHAFAASLLDQDCLYFINVEGNDPLWSQLLAEAPGPPPEPSRLPAFR